MGHTRAGGNSSVYHPLPFALISCSPHNRLASQIKFCRCLDTKEIIMKVDISTSVHGRDYVKSVNWKCSLHISLWSVVSWANCANSWVLWQNEHASLVNWVPKRCSQRLHSVELSWAGLPVIPASLLQQQPSFIYSLMASSSNDTRSWEKFFYFTKE